MTVLNRVNRDNILVDLEALLDTRMAFLKRHLDPQEFINLLEDKYEYRLTDDLGYLMADEDRFKGLKTLWDNRDASLFRSGDAVLTPVIHRIGEFVDMINVTNDTGPVETKLTLAINIGNFDFSAAEKQSILDEIKELSYIKEVSLTSYDPKVHSINYLFGNYDTYICRDFGAVMENNHEDILRIKNHKFAVICPYMATQDVGEAYEKAKEINLLEQANVSLRPFLNITHLLLKDFTADIYLPEEDNNPPGT